MSLVFYGTGTTGRNAFFDQILQFAAVRTDADFNEIDRVELHCRLLPHVVPSLDVMCVKGVTVSQLIDPSIPSHYDMICAVRAKLLSWSPALFIGWNSIGFDEVFVRQALYKTLHNPYLTNRDGNSRSDAMRIAQACSLIAPSVLTFPIDDFGQKVFDLDRIAPANGFKYDRTHHAMGDVEVTILLCLHVSEKAPDLWSSFMRFSTKAAVVDYITDERIYCVSDWFFGNPYSYMVTTIGHNPINNAEWYVYDLSIDPDSLMSHSDAMIAVRLAQSPKPVRRLKANAAPMLFSAEDAPGICRALAHGLEELERRAETLQANAALRARLISAFESLKKEYLPSPHVEKQIYDGFVEKPDEILMNAFHEAEWPQRYAIVEKFQDPRLRMIGRQLIHVERPDLLDMTICREHQLAAAMRLLGQGEDISWLTVPQSLKLLEEMLGSTSGAEWELLCEYEQYLYERYEQAMQALGLGVNPADDTID